MTYYEATFSVIGKPQGKGSWRSVRGGRIIPVGGAKLKAWEHAVRLAASRNAPDEPLDCPVALHLTFWLPCPKKPRFNRPAVKPDWDKLARSTCDAMTGVIYKDDARIVRASVDLLYCSTEHAGVRIKVRALD